MVNRRTTILAMVGAGVSCTVVGRVLEAEQAPSVSVNSSLAASDSERALKDDLATMGSHEYSDEGIPVFLACVDLVAQKAGKPVAEPTKLSKQVAVDLRRYGDAWQRLHPDAPDSDVSKVIEVLAVRDFAGSGKVGAR
jgi:hypothetical protein